MRVMVGVLFAAVVLAACGDDDGTPDPVAATITVDPPRLLADGRTKATVIVTLRDSSGQPVAGQLVTLTVGNARSTLSADSGTTDELGVFVTTISSTTSGEEVINATAGDTSIMGEVTLDPVAPACGFLLDTDVLFDVVDVDKDGNLDLLGARGLLLGLGDGTFDPPLPGPSLASVGDIDGDGDLDAVDINLSQGVIVNLGAGDGTFVHSAVAPTPPLTTDGPAIGDFDGDGDADVAVVTQQSERVVAVLASNGDGTLQSAADTLVVYPLTFPDETGSIVVKAADFDEDGRADLLAVASPTTTVEVALANLDGTFPAPVSFSRGTMGNLGLVISDIDDDGHVDVAGTGPASIAILRGRGDGTFENAVEFPSSSPILSIATGDLDRDGIRDLIVGSATGVVFAAGNGDGSFDDLAAVVGGERLAARVLAGDFDGDTHDDLAAQVGPTGTTILLGDGQGFGPGASQLDIPDDIQPDEATGKVFDLDSDGHPDLIITMFEVDSGKASLGTFRGHGDGTFEPMVEVTPSFVLPFVFADFDRDGDRDVVGSVVSGSTLELYANTAGTLALAADFAVDLVNRDLAVGDVNGDEKPDIVVAGIGAGSTLSVVTFLGDGLGGFAEPTIVTVVGVPTNGPHGFAIGDLDGDGFADVAVSSDSEISVLFGTTDGTLESALVLESVPVTLAIEDVDDDGALDLVAGSNDITVYLNTSNRTFGAGLVSSPPDAANGFGSGAITMVDFDRDSILDIATATGLIGFGVGDGTFVRSSRYPPFDAIADLDHDGIVDLLSGLRASRVCR